MNSPTLRRFLAAGIALLVFAPAASADRARLAVDAAHPGPKVSPLLYGIFFEEINHAGDGGLYAERVRNRSFEDAAMPEGWTPIAEGGAEGKVELDAEQPLNGATPHSLRIETTRLEGGRFGVANAGYWGIPTTRGRAYRLSLHARGAGGLDASLEDAAGRAYARERIEGLGPGWKRFKATLKPNGTVAAARLLLHPERVAPVTLPVRGIAPRAGPATEVTPRGPSAEGPPARTRRGSRGGAGPLSNGPQPLDCHAERSEASPRRGHVRRRHPGIGPCLPCEGMTVREERDPSLRSG